MNHGEFHRSAELVAAIHRGAGGVFPSYRAAHAYGRFYAGTFTADPAAKDVSRASHFQGTPVPVTARFSGVGGNPEDKPSTIVAMSTKFYLADGTVTDMISITLPAFLTRTPDEFIEFIDARFADPQGHEPDPEIFAAFLAGHPNTARVVHKLLGQPALVSFARMNYRPLHTFRFVNASGEARWARYHWEPEAGVAGQSKEALAAHPKDHLFDEFEERLWQGPVGFRLELELAQDGDSVDDPSLIWPDDRERVVVGRMELNRAITENEIGDSVMMHDPTAVTDGIEISPGDEVIAARRGAYLLSAAERTGGWQQRADGTAARTLAQGG
ncbi:catalase family peroxidase [Streptomyces sp. NPDC048281]|uniref:catalase family peroxidase n=1 Tax=Streptomyces sp. NPDC048281 TaxID=3154715 RepID=UPI003442056A